MIPSSFWLDPSPSPQEEGEGRREALERAMSKVRGVRIHLLPKAKRDELMRKAIETLLAEAGQW